MILIITLITKLSFLSSLKTSLRRRLLLISSPQFQKHFRFNDFFKCRDRVLKNFLLTL